MSGNVWEWCSDWYGDYKGGAVTNPTGAVGGSYRVMRGGCWLNYADLCRPSYRNYHPDYVSHNIGFRLVFPLQLTGKLDNCH